LNGTVIILTAIYALFCVPYIHLPIITKLNKIKIQNLP